MNRENYFSSAGADVSASVSSSMVPPGDRAFSGSDEGFQKLLLRIAAKSGERPDPNKLIQLFCQATREFFDVSGVYFWRCQPGNEIGRAHV